MNSEQMKAGNRPRGSAPAKWIPSRMATNLSRRWPPGSGNEHPTPSLIGRQLTGYGGSEIVIESSVRDTGYIREEMKRKVDRQLTGFDGAMEEHVVESSNRGSDRPRAMSMGIQRSPSYSPAGAGAVSTAPSSSKSATPVPKANGAAAAKMPKPVPKPTPKPKANDDMPPKSNGVAPSSETSSSASTPSGSVANDGEPAPAAPTAPAASHSSHQVVRKQDEPQSYSSSSYKFVYLNLRARGEVSRLLFAAAGQDYENVLFDAPMDFNLADFWSAREKSPDSFPYGQLPILEVDGQIIAQAHAIERFLAERFGMLAKPGSIERAQIDAVVEHCTDIFNKFLSHVFSPNKDDLIVQHYNEYFPQKCDYLEALLQKNGTGWMVGDSMTLADIAVYQNVLMTGVPDYVRQSLEGFNPLLLALGEKVEANPGIARWLTERPDTFL